MDINNNIISLLLFYYYSTIICNVAQIFRYKTCNLYQSGFAK